MRRASRAASAPQRLARSSKRAALAGLIATLAACGAQSADAHQPSASAAAAQYAPYVTKTGDNLFDISDRYLRDSNDWRVLARLNRVSEPRHLPPGMTLRLPVALLKRTNLTASVVAMSGPVERAFRDGPFLPLTDGATLTEGDRLRTGDNGFVTLELADGSHLSLPSNSQIDLHTLQQTALTGTTVRHFELKRGEVDSEVTHATRKDDRFQIRSPSVVAGVRGTQFRVDYDDAQQATAVEVLDGTVGVDRASAAAQRDAMAAEQLVHARYGSVTRATGGVGGPIALLGAPALTNPAKVQDDPAVAFDLQPLAGAARYRVAIARDAGVLDRVRDERVDGPHASFADLADGTYFVRLSAIDANGLEGLPQTYAFERRLTGLSTSAARRAGSRDFEFRWLVSQANQAQANPQAKTRFRFVLAATPDLQHPIVDRVDLDAGHLVVSNLPAGVYYWTVVAEQFENGKFYEKGSPVQSFTLAY
ncbi:LysM peptidoglycan-binding domain-containing protein [Trinickia violacea]|uniref:LysM peptidoglycan-binding domain-containing protein n=1 Tax=Trinickia violacea TaxID=2571746 RepID=A0A4P8IQ39_9BURK|nr:FecR domain-containing protein [Trinickia violacea]QCP49173.1 LysM peptidoglycan-binding domain-containing protein [Trinickia violacea]